MEQAASGAAVTLYSRTYAANAGEAEWPQGVGVATALVISCGSSLYHYTYHSLHTDVFFLYLCINTVGNLPLHYITNII